RICWPLHLIGDTQVCSGVCSCQRPLWESLRFGCSREVDGRPLRCKDAEAWLVVNVWCIHCDSNCDYRTEDCATNVYTFPFLVGTSYTCVGFSVRGVTEASGETIASGTGST